MRMSSSLIASATVAILSTALLCSLTSAAMSQTNPSSSLPSVTVLAPKQVATPQRRMARPLQRPQVASTSAYRPLSPDPAPGAVMARFAAFEKIASRANSSCADGCPTSFRSGNQPWVGCSSPGNFVLSTTCRNAANFKTYEECREVGMFVGWRSGEVSWFCSSLQASGKLSGEKQQQVAERSGRR